LKRLSCYFGSYQLSAVTKSHSKGTRFELVQRIGFYLLDLVFPPRCVGCLRLGQLFCDFCAQRVLPAPSRQVCQRCGLELPGDVRRLGFSCPGCNDALGWVEVAALFEDPLQQAVHALKYDDESQLGTSLGRYLRAVTAEAPWPAIMGRLDGVVPVPLHKDRLRARGYNQARLLAAALALEASTPVLVRAIERFQATSSQVGLSPSERSENVNGKFRADSELVAGKVLLLVDDVFTTGATMRECASVLRDAGAEAVYGIALASPATR